MFEFLENSVPITSQQWSEDTVPLVSISCITYNHENFIRDAIEGFLMQKTTFPVEILVHDDASTDKTASIVREYEEQYPHLIKPIYQTENQYSKRDGSIDRIQRGRARGKYVALCEGDDYWTEPLKLQKQVDFLENNPDYSLCVSGFKEYNIYTEQTKDILRKPNGLKLGNNGYSFTLWDIRKAWLTKTLTAVFVNDEDVLKKMDYYKYGRDINLFYHLLKSGKGYYFTELFGVYRIHQGGINSMKHGIVNTINAYNIYKELFNINGDRFSKHMHVVSGINYLGHILFHKSKKNTSQIKLNLLSEIIKNITSIDEILLFIKVVILSNIKLFFLHIN